MVLSVLRSRYYFRSRQYWVSTVKKAQSKFNLIYGGNLEVGNALEECFNIIIIHILIIRGEYMKTKNYYVYGYIRLDTNTYFYIGKGKDDR